MKYNGTFISFDTEDINWVTPLARTTDPVTSHEAAQAINGRRASLKAQCLGCILASPGLTAGEIGEATGLGHQRVWRRISDLKNDGLIEPGPPRMWHGRRQLTWKVKPKQGVLL